MTAVSSSLNRRRRALSSEGGRGERAEARCDASWAGQTRFGRPLFLPRRPADDDFSPRRPARPTVSSSNASFLFRQSLDPLLSGKGSPRPASARHVGPVLGAPWGPTTAPWLLFRATARSTSGDLDDELRAGTERGRALRSRHQRGPPGLLWRPDRCQLA
jgi:hypothetical protein